MNINIKNLSAVEIDKLKKILKDPVLWAKAFVVSYDKEQRKYVPWSARWYQKEMLRDNSIKRVFRCGRRTGVICPRILNCGDIFIRLYTKPLMETLCGGYN